MSRKNEETTDWSVGSREARATAIARIVERAQSIAATAPDWVATDWNSKPRTRADCRDDHRHVGHGGHPANEAYSEGLIADRGPDVRNAVAER